MTASPTPTHAVPGDVGLPSEEDVSTSLATAIMALDWKARKDWTVDEQADRHGELQEIIEALIRPAFEAKDQRIRELAALLDKQMGTPCEQIRHRQEIEALRLDNDRLQTKACGAVDHARIVEAQAADAEAAWSVLGMAERRGYLGNEIMSLQDSLGRALFAAHKAEARALSAEAGLSGLRQAILDAAVICDDDEKAGDRLDKLARAIRARSASVKEAP